MLVPRATRLFRVCRTRRAIPVATPRPSLTVQRRLADDALGRAPNGERAIRNGFTRRPPNHVANQRKPVIVSHTRA